MSESSAISCCCQSSISDGHLENCIADNGVQEIVVLVIGACALDRILVVPSFPQEDAKIRATTYHECGGGNAANTAFALAKLSSSALLFKNIRVKLLSKIGSDSHVLKTELQQSGVDVSLLIEQPETTTSHTTVLVSESTNTRTCIHSPGTCGELTLADLPPMDDVFQNVQWVHLDTRHTNVALYLAKEASRRNIPNISVDAEKDRGPDMAELIDLSTMLFTNSSHFTSLLNRTISNETNIIPYSDSSQSRLPSIVTESSMLCHHFCSTGRNKRIIVTNGEKGALHVMLMASHCSCENTTNVNVPSSHHPTLRTCSSQSVLYQTHQVKAFRNIQVVDTTGAGDCFIAGFILSSLSNPIHNDSFCPIQFSLMLGSWTAGKKIEGLGSRSCTLPSGDEINRDLGKDYLSIWKNLSNMF